MAEAVARSVDDYRRLQAALPGQRLSWLQRLREAAMQRFAERGYPTRRDEAWKYTDVGPLVAHSFAPALTEAEPPRPAALAPYLPAGLNGHRLVFCNGRWAPGLSELDGLPPGISIGSLAQGLDAGAPGLEAVLADADHYPAQAQAFSELNTAFMSDGALIRLAPGARLERPLHMIHITAGAEGTAAHVRNLILAGAGSRAVIVEHYVSLAGAQALSNVLTQCLLEEAAEVTHYRLNEEAEHEVYHVAGVTVRQARNSRYVAHHLALGARLVRSGLDVRLAGEGSACTLNGLYVGRGQQQFDNDIRVDHQAARTESRQWYRGVLDGRARGSFTGRVVVHPNAQQIDARQANHSLLLSDEAEANSRPQLEIYADDVQCSHGSTVGQLDQDALFYLRARGVAEHHARRLLVLAFAGDVIERMELAPLRARLQGALEGGKIGLGSEE